MLLAWTSVASQADADRIAANAIRTGLAACVQVEGPITSHYRWEGREMRDQEYRLCFKFLPEHRQALEQQVLASHPYDTPEWVVVATEHVAEKYLCWAKATSSK